jgi:parallel beta-helix repeat protein
MKPSITIKSAASIFILGGSIFMSSDSFSQALSGTYSINAALPTGSGNFNSFNDAVTRLTTYGVNGAVIFNIEPATYTEQVIIPEIAGASAINTITFNGSEATLKNYASNTNERAVIKLNGADYITINGLNIMAGDTATSVYGYGIQLINDADHNKIQNCNISVPFVYSPSVVTNYAGLVLNSSPTSIVTQGDAGSDDNLIESNTVTGGYHGIALVASGNSAMISGNKILNNAIRDFYNAGIYIDGNMNTTVNANDISRPSRTTGALFYGIQLNNTSYNTIISNNKIHDPFGGTAAYVNSGANGIYFSNVNASAGKENVCFNNIIYNFKAGSIIRGIWISGSPFNQFLHNTLSLDDNEYTGFGATTGFEISSSTDLAIHNNVVSIKRVGSSFITRYGINISPVTGCALSNNDISIAAGSTYYFGKYGSTNCADVTQWATSTGDNTSTDVEPGFMDPSNGNLKPTNTGLVSGMATNITTDILGLGRNPLPTMGAFEINGTPLPVKMSLLKAHLNAKNQPVLSWETYSEQNNKGFEIQRSGDAKNWNAISFVNGKGSNSNNYLYNDETAISAKIYYRLKQVDKNEASDFSNVVWLNTSDKNVSIEAYPNPAHNIVYLNLLNENISDAAFVISNAGGRIVKKGNLDKNATKIIISDFSDGIYLISVKSGSKMFYSKFIKQ